MHLQKRTEFVSNSHVPGARASMDVMSMHSLRPGHFTVHVSDFSSCWKRTEESLTLLSQALPAALQQHCEACTQKFHAPWHIEKHQTWLVYAGTCLSQIHLCMKIYLACKQSCSMFCVFDVFLGISSTIKKWTPPVLHTFANDQRCLLRCSSLLHDSNVVLCRPLANSQRQCHTFCNTAGQELSITGDHHVVKAQSAQYG